MVFYPYGTAGFRFNNKIILELATKIGEAAAILSIKKNAYIGIMITASHNQYEDNGVKIINYNGHMLNSDDEKFISNYVNNDDYKIDFDINSKIKIVIGMDTRESSPLIKNKILNALHNISIKSTSHIIDIDYVTTPMIHYETQKINNKINLSYYDYYYSPNRFNVINNIIIDCANGVGAIWMKKFLTSNAILVNDKIDNYELLNNKCGSDYVCNNKIIPHEYINTDKLMVSFDGDADRIVFYFIDNENFCLLDGDRISSLIVKYIIDVLKNYEKINISIGVIHTAYSNGNFIKFIESIQTLSGKITTVCTATGVKNLHKEAEKYDIGIYFEANGHGTVLFNNSKLTDKIEELKELKEIFNQYVGDSISNLVGIMTILNKSNISYNDWYNLYKNKPNILTKIHIADKSIYLSETNEKRLIAPINVQKYLDSIINKYIDLNIFCFVRASGTENILRLYVEIDKEINDINLIKISNDISEWITKI